nr:hypothetical protein [Tanacetum cinerariifolium]
VCGGPHYSSNCQTRNLLVYEPNPCYNYDFSYFDQPPQYHIDQSPPQDLESERLSKIEINHLREDVLSTQIPNPLFDLDTEESDNDTEVIFDKELFLRERNLAHVTPPSLTYTPPLPFLATIQPLDTFLMGDEVISTTSTRENDEFIQSIVNDLVSIPRESEVTLVSTDFECIMPTNSPPLPCIVVLGYAKVVINLPFGEHLDTISMEDKEIDFNPSDLEIIDPVPDPRMFDVPLGDDDAISRSFDVPISNPLFDFDDNYSLIIDNKIFDDKIEDLSSLGPLKETPLINESLILVTPLPDAKKICLREVETFDPFFSLTQSGDMTWVMERPSYRFPHLPLPRQVAYSPKVHIEVLSVLWENRLLISDGLLSLSRFAPIDSEIKKVEEIPEGKPLRLLARGHGFDPRRIPGCDVIITCHMATDPNPDPTRPDSDPLTRSIGNVEGRLANRRLPRGHNDENDSWILGSKRRVFIANHW